MPKSVAIGNSLIYMRSTLYSVIVLKKVAIAGGVILGILLISFLIVLRYVGIGIFSLRQ